MGTPSQQVESERYDVDNASIITSRAAPTQFLEVFNSSTGGQYITLEMGNKQASPGAGLVLAPHQGRIFSNDSRFTSPQGDIKAIAHDAAYAATTGGKLTVVRY